MLTPAQADAAAKVILAHAEGERAIGRKALPIAPAYRSRELSKLDPLQQEMVVKKATAVVSNQPQAALAFCAWIAICTAFYLYVPAGSSFPFASGGSLIVAVTAPFSLLVFFVRRQTQKVLRALATQTERA